MKGEDWFSRHIPYWRDAMAPLFCSKPMDALEVGSYEGRSALWIVQEMLTHPQSTLTCVDTWDGKDKVLGFSTATAEHEFDRNLAPYIGKLRKLKARSIDALTMLVQEHRRFSLVHIDGCHEGLTVLSDLLLSWELLEPGGFLVADDYRWASRCLRAQPKDAWDAFAAMRPRMSLEHQFRQCIARKE
jgi:predicted O-methyltransferase YrrM